MSYKRFLTIFTVVVLVSLLLTGQALADKKNGATERLSMGLHGTQANGGSTQVSISADGRYVSFTSRATNLVTGDANGEQDVFLLDTHKNKTILISVASDGTQGNGGSNNSDVSDDGNYVVFMSHASNLVAGDTNNAQEVFLRDVRANTTTRISVASDGTQINSNSGCPAISADGRYVTFCSKAPLSPMDTNNASDVFLRDTQENTTTPISVAPDGTEGNKESGLPAISADGRYIVFSSWASNLVDGDTNNTGDIFLRDMQTSTTTRISLASDGTQGNDESDFRSAISNDGRYVVFWSCASNLVPGDTNGKNDIFLRDTQTNTTTRVSISSDGDEGNNPSNFPNISADGRYVVFESDASNLVKKDTNNETDIFLRDTQTNETTLVSASSKGKQGNSYSNYPSVSIGGRVVFDSNADNLVPEDTNESGDVFMHEIDEKPGPQPALLPATGFAPGRITVLSPSTAEIYSNLSMRLEIPTLKLNAAVVSVPKKGVSNWNVSGLGGNIGYLSGTVFPTQKGNAVLTGHLYDANGQPGPFINLEKMKRGQQIIIHANGRQYVYVVISVKKWVDPSTTGILANQESHPWLTLITCSGYDAKANSYRWRTVVRATLVNILNKP